MLTLGGLLLGMASVEILAMGFLLWVSTLVLLTIHVEVRLWPSALGFTAAFFVHALWPRWGYLWISASTAILLANSAIVWWPWSAEAKRARDKRAADVVPPAG